MTFPQIRKVTLIIFIFCFLLVFLFVVYKHTNPFGRPRVYNYSFSPKPNRFISPLRPKIRLSRSYQNEKGDSIQDLKGPLVYFDLEPVRRDQKLTLTIRYKTEVPEIIFGEVSSATEDLEYKPHSFYNEFLQNLDWPQVQEGSVFLYQKEKHFSSVGEYLENVPQDKNNAVYFFSDSRIKNAKVLTHFAKPQEEIDYIITTHKKASPTLDGFLETTLNFSLADSFFKPNKISKQEFMTFLFAIPALENYTLSANNSPPHVTVTHIKAVISEPPSKYWVRAKKLLGIN